jgi:hypothetical protein
MTAKIENGLLIITLPMQTPAPSSTGKTLVVASSHGNTKTDLQVDGKTVRIGVNAFIEA